MKDEFGQAHEERARRGEGWEKSTACECESHVHNTRCLRGEPLPAGKGGLKTLGASPTLFLLPIRLNARGVHATPLQSLAESAQGFLATRVMGKCEGRTCTTTRAKTHSSPAQGHGIDFFILFWTTWSNV